ncbi:hypothetical protein [Xanthomonas sacchari]|uniref:hypothetical protein n=1 Tax=Xanthomonas sacchari TaxID=56458 RepID=UPI0005820DFA|nr:hypothetical protein [Xanthomonas sacchari]AJC46255.1 hypothetical protein SB85_11260 [Xanthomonas sacchari]
MTTRVGAADLCADRHGLPLIQEHCALPELALIAELRLRRQPRRFDRVQFARATHARKRITCPQLGCRHDRARLPFPRRPPP